MRAALGIKPGSTATELADDELAAKLELLETDTLLEELWLLLDGVKLLGESPLPPLLPQATRQVREKANNEKLRYVMKR